MKKAKWRLNKNHQVELRLRNKLILKGDIVTAEKDGLVIEIKSVDKSGHDHFRSLKIKGSWQADRQNRIIFIVKKEVRPSVLTFQGTWRVNKQQQIVYTYERIEQKRKTKVIHSILFEGSWQITTRNKLTYNILHSSESRFDFRVQLENKSLKAQDGALKYLIGIGSKTKSILLFGNWRITRSWGVAFEIDYGEGKTRKIEFSVDKYLSQRDKVIFSLANKRREPLGISITFTHKFLKQQDAKLFLRLKGSAEEASVEAGAKIPF